MITLLFFLIVDVLTLLVSAVILIPVAIIEVIFDPVLAGIIIVVIILYNVFKKLVQK